MVGTYQLARMCQASYAPEKSYPELPRFAWSYNTNEYCEMRVEGSTVYIVFRGSDDVRDWARNADMHLVDTAIGAVHHGFRKGWLDLCVSIVSRLEHLDEAPKTIICTGHSRGGPLAIQCHEALSWGHPDIVLRTVTFGCPPFCDQEYAADTDKLMISNFQMGWVPFLRDPVPHMLPTYSRPGKNIKLSGFGRPSKMHKIERYVAELSK